MILVEAWAQTLLVEAWDQTLLDPIPKMAQLVIRTVSQTLGVALLVLVLLVLWEASRQRPDSVVRTIFTASLAVEAA